jgi:hypothetical protein
MTIRMPNYITLNDVEKDPLGANEVVRDYATYRMYYDFGLKMMRRRKHEEKEEKTSSYSSQRPISRLRAKIQQQVVGVASN